MSFRFCAVTAEWLSFISWLKVRSASVFLSNLFLSTGCIRLVLAPTISLFGSLAEMRNKWASGATTRQPLKMDYPQKVESLNTRPVSYCVDDTVLSSVSALDGPEDWIPPKKPPYVCPVVLGAGHRLEVLAGPCRHHSGEAYPQWKGVVMWRQPKAIASFFIGGKDNFTSLNEPKFIKTQHWILGCFWF